MNCSKILLKNPWDFTDVYNGKYAKYFDECHRSQADSANGDDPQVTAIFYERDWFDAVVERLWRGTVDPESATGCKALPLIGTTSAVNDNGELVKSNDGSELMRMYYQRIFDVLYDMSSAKKRTYSGHYSVFDWNTGTLVYFVSS